MDRTEANQLSDREVMILRGMYDMADHPPRHLREYHRMQYVLGYLLAEGRNVGLDKKRPRCFTHAVAIFCALESFAIAYEHNFWEILEEGKTKVSKIWIEPRLWSYRNGHNGEVEDIRDVWEYHGSRVW